MIPSLQAGLVYPVDLGAWGYCRQHKLRHAVSDVFYNQKKYNEIFETVVRVLMEKMYDASLFSDYLRGLNAQVNLLFIPLYQLVALYGGVILKIYELNQLIRESAGKQVFILEECTKKKKHMPISDYYDVVNYMFHDKITLAATEGNHAPAAAYARDDIQKRIVGLRTQAFCFFSNAFSQLNRLRRRTHEVELGLLHDVIDLKMLVRQARASGWISNIKLHYFPKQSFKQHTFARKIIGKVLPHINEQLCAQFSFISDYERFSQTIEHIYEQHIHEIEGPVAAILPLDTLTGTLQHHGPQYLIARTAVRPWYRAFVYRKYLEGYRIVTQEYADGPGNGAAARSVFVYKSAPIAALSLYSYAQYLPELLDFITQYGCKNPGLTLASVGPFLKMPVKKPGLESRVHHKQKQRICYLPDAYVGKARIGTNRELNDLVCWNMQQHILETLCDIDGTELIFKVHPKGFYQRITSCQVEYMKQKGITVETERIDTMLHDIDVVVSERFGSGLFKCLHARVPVVYLDFGDFGTDKFFSGFKDHLKQSVACWIEASRSDDSWKDVLKTSIKKILKEQPVTYNRQLHAGEATAYKGARYVLDIIKKHKEQTGERTACRSIL